MANRYPHDHRDLDEVEEALPADLQPLYQRLSADGSAWRAASAGKIETLARSLVADIERMSAGQGEPSPSPVLTQGGEPETTAPLLRGEGSYKRRRVREWIAGTVAAVAVVALLALVLQGALIGRGNIGPTNTRTNTPHSGRWQILDELTWKRTSSGQTLPIIAPSNPQVVYEATNAINGQGGEAVTYASLRRTDDGGKSWRTLALPLPLADISLLTARVSPLRAQTVFLSLWDRSNVACEPTNGTVSEGCERGYVSFDGGATWQTQRLPVPGVVDTGGGIQAQVGSIYAQNACNGTACLHLLGSDDGGRTWRVVDSGMTTNQRYICDFSATASGHTLYAVASLTDCSQPPDSKTLWRSDDAGRHWRELGPLLSTPLTGQWFSAFGGLLLTAPGTAHPALLYLNVPYTSTDSGPRFYYTEDSGATWKTTPAVPDVPRCASQGMICDGIQPLAIGETVVLSDGSLFYLPFDSPNKPLTPYIWTPGDHAWQRLPQLPAQVAGPGSIIVTSGANGHDTITMALRANVDASNPYAYYVVRYQM